MYFGSSMVRLSRTLVRTAAVGIAGSFLLACAALLDLGDAFGIPDAAVDPDGSEAAVVDAADADAGFVRSRCPAGFGQAVAVPGFLSPLDYSVRFTPDTAIAFTAEVRSPAVKPDLYIRHRLPGGGYGPPAKLLDTPFSERNPTPTSDGLTIYFGADDGGTRSQIFRASRIGDLLGPATELVELDPLELEGEHQPYLPHDGVLYYAAGNILLRIRRVVVFADGGVGSPEDLTALRANAEHDDFLKEVYAPVVTADEHVVFYRGRIDPSYDADVPRIWYACRTDPGDGGDGGFGLPAPGPIAATGEFVPVWVSPDGAQLFVVHIVSGSPSMLLSLETR
jgi:hypothetical protein